MNATSRTTVRLSPEAQAHIAAQTNRTFELLGGPETNAAAVDRIIREHARMTAWIDEGYAAHAYAIQSVGQLLEALEGEEMRVIDSEEDSTNFNAKTEYAELEHVFLNTAVALAKYRVAENPRDEISVQLLAKHATYKEERARTKKIEEARANAQRLLEELGMDHPRAFAAVLDFVELRDPGATKRALKESGINLPAPTHVDEGGNPIYASMAIADVLGMQHDEVVEGIEQMQRLAPEFAPVGGEFHRVQ